MAIDTPRRYRQTLKSVAVQSCGFWGSDEGWECAAVLVGGEEIAEVGDQAAVL